MRQNATCFTTYGHHLAGRRRPGMIVAFIQRRNVPMPQPKDELTIQAVNSRTQLKEFIQLPQALYRQDANWVKPLFLEQKERFSNKNPFFQHARWQAWIARRGQRPVGRISAQIDELHLQRHQDQTGHFGCLEAEDDAARIQSPVSGRRKLAQSRRHATRHRAVQPFHQRRVRVADRRL